MNRRIVNELLSLKDICGTKDPTPYEAVKEIVRMSKNQLNKKQQSRQTDKRSIITFFEPVNSITIENSKKSTSLYHFFF